MPVPRDGDFLGVICSCDGDIRSRSLQTPSEKTPVRVSLRREVGTLAVQFLQQSPTDNVTLDADDWGLSVPATVTFNASAQGRGWGAAFSAVPEQQTQLTRSAQLRAGRISQYHQQSKRFPNRQLVVARAEIRLAPSRAGVRQAEGAALVSVNE